MSYLAAEWRALWSFIKAPYRRRPDVAPLSEVVRRTGFLLGVDCLFTLVVALPLNWALEHWAGITEIEQDLNSLEFWITAILFAPLIEELLCRAGLRSRIYTLFFGPCLLLAMMGLTEITALPAAIIAGAAVYDFWRSRSGPGQRFARGRVFIERYRYVFWFYAATFGLLHMQNFEFQGPGGVFVVLAVASQALGGFTLGYLRLRHGLWSAIAYHATFNLIAVSLAWTFDL